MEYLTYVQHRELPVLPMPRPAIKEKMLAIATLFDGPIDLSPHRTGIVPEGCWWLPAAQLLLCGTACRAPLLLEEVGEACLATGLSGIVVRQSDDPGQPEPFTFDVFHGGLWHVHRLLFLSTSGAARLVSGTGTGPSFQLDQHGIIMCDDDAAREDCGCGVSRGRAYLSSFTRRR